LSRILKVILIIILFGLFFEGGLISSYTIVTSQPPDVAGLIDMQINKISAIWGSITRGSGNLLNPQETLKILNPDDVANALKSKANIAGVNLQSLSATTHDNTDNDMIAVNITAMGYRESVLGGNRTGGQIVITPNATYTINARAMAKTHSNGVEVDVNTIEIISVKQMYSEDMSGSTS
jgi:hypothetical protein